MSEIEFERIRKLKGPMLLETSVNAFLYHEICPDCGWHLDVTKDERTVTYECARCGLIVIQPLQNHRR